MQKPEEETPHLNPIKGSRSLITEQQTAECLQVGKGGDVVSLMFWAKLEMFAQPGTSRRSKLVCRCSKLVCFSSKIHCCYKPASDAGATNTVREAAAVRTCHCSLRIPNQTDVIKSGAEG